MTLTGCLTDGVIEKTTIIWNSFDTGEGFDNIYNKFK